MLYSKMKIGVYRIVSKKAAKDFYVVGTANIENYYAKYDPAVYKYELLRETAKYELNKYEKHFQTKFGTKAVEEVKPVIEEPVKEVVKKKRVAKKK
jgi:hypothetical protein